MKSVFTLPLAKLRPTPSTAVNSSPLAKPLLPRLSIADYSADRDILNVDKQI